MPSQPPSSNRPTGREVIAKNPKARHDYFVEETLECGIVLTGTEVKSLREGKGTLNESYAHVANGEAWLIGAHIAEYGLGSWTNHPVRRNRKLLLHKAEIEHLTRETAQGGKTLIPLAMYFTGGRVKVEIALAVGKKTYDKRQSLAERDATREVARELGRRQKGMR